MELRQLRAFVFAAKYLNFSEAAQEMCVTPSTFSQSIKTLEDELGVALFLRNSHEVELTEAGITLHPFALQTVQQADDAKNRILDLKQMRKGELTIGVTHSFSALLEDTLSTFTTAYPDIQLIVHFKTRDELQSMLSERKVDFLLSYTSTKVDPQIESHILFEDRLSLIVSKTHHLAKLHSVTPQELLRHTLALPTYGMQAREVLDLILEESRITLTPKMEIDQVTPLLRLVREGSYVTVLSSAAAALDKDLKAIPISSPQGIMYGSASVLKNSYRKASMLEFIRILSQTNTMHQRFIDWAN